jgi:anti-sigma B factor antagonist
MEVTEIKHPNFTTLIPAGELDANSSMLMDEKIQAQIDAGVFKLHIDCSALRYISSAGLGVFISFMDELSANDGMFIFSGLSDNIFRVFQLLGLEQLMVIVKSAPEAAERFNA